MHITTDLKTCPRCGSANLFTVPYEGDLTRGRTGCSDCAAADRPSFIRWEPAPMSAERAAAFTMPYGKHRGSPLAAIPTGYLLWALETIGSSDVLRAVRRHLEERFDGTQGRSV